MRGVWCLAAARMEQLALAKTRAQPPMHVIGQNWTSWRSADPAMLCWPERQIEPPRLDDCGVVGEFVFGAPGKDANQYSRRSRQNFLVLSRISQGLCKVVPRYSISPGAAEKLLDQDSQALSQFGFAELLENLLLTWLVNSGKSFGQPRRNHYRFALLWGGIGDSRGQISSAAFGPRASQQR